MKTLILMGMMLLGGFVFNASAQTSTNQDEVVERPEQLAQFNGDLYQYLAKQIRYPEADKKNKVEGRVILQFVVEKDGSISSITVLKSASETLAAEAIRVVSNMPKWKPAKNNGMAVRSRFVLPIAFKLN
jgi:protein TonB